MITTISLEKRMNQPIKLKCNLFKALAWLFFGTVLVQSLYSGFRFGCWMGFITLIAGFAGGFSYTFCKRRSKCKDISDVRSG